jgi:predicted TIM-barrel fold metal-dependent hydrolase
VFLGAALAAAPPIIDTHVHLFDTTRPQGVPWPPRSNARLFLPALPPRLRQTATPHGVTGAIAIECSPWFDDNQWLLDTAATDRFVLGVVGNLEPGTPAFRGHLERFQRNPLFLGIRYGNLWGRDLASAVRRPEFIADLKALAQAGLALDTANPNPTLLDAVLELAARVPELRIVVDHLASMEPNAAVRELARHPQVYVKGSAVLGREARLHALFELFGPDRLLYGSDWPNSDQLGTYARVFGVVRDFFTTKEQDAGERFFWKNAASVYRWRAK